jgi:hypothetical protein
VVAVFVVINLFIAVVINNLETTRREESDRTAAESGDEVLHAVLTLRERLERLEQLLRRKAA